MSERIPRILAIVILGALLGSTQGLASEEQPASTIGAAGEVYTLKTGSYGELFGSWSLADEENPVLALDVTGPDQQPQRFLVPGTESSDVEDSASMVFENGSGTLFILWQTKINVIHSSLNLISFEDGSWSPTIEIWGSPFGWKTAPQLAVTRDGFVTRTEDGTRRSWSRTVVHVIWAEEDQYGPHILYSPIVLVDGNFEGRSPVYGLPELAGLRRGVFQGSVDPVLAGAPRIEDGQNSQTVVVGLTDGATGHLTTFEIEVLPGEVSHLAERLRHQIVDLGRDLFSQDRNAFADKLRHQIVDLGRDVDLHPGFTTYAASVAADGIAAADETERLVSIADRLRHQIVDLGARNTGRGVDRTLAKTGYTLLEIGSGEGARAEAAPNLIRISTVSSRPAPSTDGMASPVSLHLSRSGEEVIVAWTAEDRLLYRESRADGWSELLEIQIGVDGVATHERAHEMLRERAESRRGRLDVE